MPEHWQGSPHCVGGKTKAQAGVCPVHRHFSPEARMSGPSPQASAVFGPESIEEKSVTRPC
jgi:hypothetical protein